MVFSIKLAYQYHDLKKAASDCLLLMQVGMAALAAPAS